jgi:hypothetical protein
MQRFTSPGDFVRSNWPFGGRTKSASKSRCSFAWVNTRNDVTLAKVPDEWIAVQRSMVGWDGFRRQIGVVRIPKDAERGVRDRVAGCLYDGSLLQVGRSTTNREAVLKPFRTAFLAVGGGSDRHWPGRGRLAHAADAAPGARRRSRRRAPLLKPAI